MDIHHSMFALCNLDPNPPFPVGSWRGEVNRHCYVAERHGSVEHRKGSHFGRVHLTSTGEPRIGLGSPKDLSCYFKNT